MKQAIAELLEHPFHSISSVITDTSYYTERQRIALSIAVKEGLIVLHGKLGDRVAQFNITEKGRKFYLDHKDVQDIIQPTTPAKLCASFLFLDTRCLSEEGNTYYLPNPRYKEKETVINQLTALEFIVADVCETHFKITLTHRGQQFYQNFSKVVNKYLEDFLAAE